MKSRSFLAPVAILAWLWLAITAAHADGAARPGFGKQHPFRAEELPEGKLKSRLKSLDPQAKAKAMNWLHTFDFDGRDAAEHLRVDSGGGIFIVCPDDKGESGGTSNDSGPPTKDSSTPDGPGGIAPVTGQTTGVPTVESISVAAGSPPSYHSRPAATRRIYLDFNGGIVSGTAWNTSAAVASWSVKAWSQDADLTTFNDAEQAWMKRVWQRVSEDYAPFDVDVTTDVTYDPGNYTGNKDNVGWVLVCDTTDNNGVALPHAGSGGVAYVGVFGGSTYSPTYQPAWVTSTNGGGDESIIAEAASHEMGHNMGLSHDGTSTLGYYGGHGSGDVSWGPLMGTGYYRNVSQWSKGEYYDANQLQDDLAIITARVAYRTDDHGGTAATATPLTVTSGGTITSTTPENDPTNASPANKGVIERNTDVDVFSFYTGAGNVQLNANPWIQPAGTRGGNLDILLDLYDQAGTKVATNNGNSLTNASISATLAQGYYYLYVRNTGTGTPTVFPPSGYTSYGSIGQYFISGTIVSASPPPTLTSITPTSAFTNATATVDVTGTGISTATSFKLAKSGQPDIAATSVAAVGSILRCQFNLTAAATGAWDLVATNPNLETATLSAAFTVVGAIWTESFDSTVTGWTSQASTGSNSWNLTTVQSQSPSTSYFAAGPSSRSTTSLISPGVSVPAGATGLQLRFYHNYNLQSTRDGGKLEFSIDNGTWFDVLDSGSGASFTSGGYNSTITSNSSDFSGLAAWSGSSGGFVSTVVSLTDSAKYAGKTLKMRWRLATNSSTSSVGWYVDSIALTGSVPPSNQAPVIATAAGSTSTEIVTDPDSSVHQIIRGVSASLSLAATDDGGEPALIYNWAASNAQENPVNFSSNGTNAAKNTTAGFSAAGDYQITATVQDAQGLTATSIVNLRVVQTEFGLVVSPTSATVAVGMNQQFSAVMVDQFGIAIDSQPSSISWTASGGGSVNASGIFTASAVGNPFLITAGSGVHSGTATVEVIPGAASVTLAGLDQTYDGTPRTVTASTVPGGLGVSITYNGSPTTPTDAGSYAVIASINDPNYTGSSSGTLVVHQAAASIELAGLSPTYDGSPKSATVATTPANLTYSISYDGSPTPPTAAGNYSITVTITDPNHFGTASGLMTITKATPAIALSNLLQTYDGSPKSATATTTPAELPVVITYYGSPTPPTVAGTYPLPVTVDDANYSATASGSLVIEKAPVSIVLAGLSQVY
ncbi:MAG: MBG domain-containing protein, partial [Luteolibacter sp.]